jgi:hypothetical protein
LRLRIKLETVKILPTGLEANIELTTATAAASAVVIGRVVDKHAENLDSAQKTF